MTLITVAIATGGGVYHIVENGPDAYCRRYLSTLWQRESVEADHPRICGSCRTVAKL